MSKAWSRFDGKVLAPVRKFQQEALANTGTSQVFYPFSGPDCLMMTTLFPHGRVYVMVGLEPAGTLPDAKKFANVDLNRYLGQVRSTVASELGRSFFITRQMDRHFRGQITDGLLLPILQLLAGSGHTILGFRYVRLDESGRLIERAADYHAPGKIGNKGVEIDFKTDADGSEHKLVYLSVNLSDASLRDNQAFLDFVTGLRRPASFFKATSYMTHKSEFSIIRDKVLATSGAVLQDDSGIPYHYFPSSTWRVQLYGEYSRPYGSFRWLEQRDLKKAYSTLNPRPLEFRIGYGFGKIPSNLLLATKVDSVASAEPPTLALNH